MSYQLTGLNWGGEEIYAYKGDDLDATIAAGRSVLADVPDAQYVYIIELTARTVEVSVYFAARHIWFAAKDEKEADPVRSETKARLLAALKSLGSLVTRIHDGRYDADAEVSLPRHSAMQDARDAIKQAEEEIKP